MSKLAELITRCKCSVSVEVNQHRAYYQVAEFYLAERDVKSPEDVAADVFAKMVETDTVVEVQFYPSTPIGFYRIWHYDVDAALGEAIAALDAEDARSRK